jgi:hypothetical protein
MFIPGWNPVAHVLFLDLTNGTRMRIGVGFASFVIVGSIARDLDDDGLTPPARIAWVSVAIFAGSQCAIAAAVLIVQGSGHLWQGSPLWPLAAAVSSAAIYLIIRSRVLLGAIAFLVVSVWSSVAVNPLYIGVLDLRTTAVSQAIVRINRTAPMKWVGVGGSIESSLLMESGVTAFNGTQGAPPPLMWREVDPSRRYVENWNRLGAVEWVTGKGEPVVTNPAEDVIQATFDGCSRFAQQNVGYVLSDNAIHSPCLSLDSRYAVPGGHLTIYRVHSKSGAVPTG